MVKRATVLSVCAILALGSFAPAHAAFYKWVDHDGREFYTNDLEKVPAEYRGSATSVEVRDDRVSVDHSAASDSGLATATASPEHKDKYGRGEEYWKKRAENLRRQIREKQDDYDLLVQKERDAERKSAGRHAKSKKSSSQDKKKAALEKKLARLRHELDVELPEEARKADAYPGWIRD